MFVSKYLQILTRLTRSCLVDIGGDARKPRKHEQRLLRNMGAHTVVLDLLKIPYDTVGSIFSSATSHLFLSTSTSHLVCVSL